MRRALLLLILVGGICIMPTASFSQGKKGFGGFDPNEAFNRLSGGKDVIIISELDPQRQGMVKMMAQRFNLTGDRITREQYKTAMENVTKMFQKDGGGGPPAAPGGMMKIGGGPGGFGGPPAPPGGIQGQPNQGNTNSRGSDPDALAEQFFRRSDRDQDGLLKFEELSETLQRERDTYDTNKDGFISLEEYKPYIVSRTKKDNPAPTDKSATPEEKKSPENNAPIVTETPQTYKEDPRPQIFRAGKLPTKDLPDWFIRLDKEGDSDGQVGLYEYKTLNKGTDDFMAMDLNGDGLLTAEEYLRWKGNQKKTEGDQIASGDGTSRGPNSERRGDNGNRDNGAPRFPGPPGGGFGPPPIGGGFGPPMGGEGGFGGGRFGGPPKDGGFGGGRFGGPPKGGDGNNGGFGGGRFGGPPKGGDSGNNGNNGNSPRKKG